MIPSSVFLGADSTPLAKTPRCYPVSRVADEPPRANGSRLAHGATRGDAWLLTMSSHRPPDGKRTHPPTHDETETEATARLLRIACNLALMGDEPVERSSRDARRVALTTPTPSPESTRNANEQHNYNNTHHSEQERKGHGDVDGGNGSGGNGSGGGGGGGDSGHPLGDADTNSTANNVHVKGGGHVLIITPPHSFTQLCPSPQDRTTTNTTTNTHTKTSHTTPTADINSSHSALEGSPLTKLLGSVRRRVLSRVHVRRIPAYLELVTVLASLNAHSPKHRTSTHPMHTPTSQGPHSESSQVHYRYVIVHGLEYFLSRVGGRHLRQITHSTTSASSSSTTTAATTTTTTTTTTADTALHSLLEETSIVTPPSRTAAVSLVLALLHALACRWNRESSCSESDTSGANSGNGGSHLCADKTQSINQALPTTPLAVHANTAHTPQHTLPSPQLRTTAHALGTMPPLPKAATATAEQSRESRGSLRAAPIVGMKRPRTPSQVHSPLQAQSPSVPRYRRGSPLITSPTAQNTARRSAPASANVGVVVTWACQRSPMLHRSGWDRRHTEVPWSLFQSHRYTWTHATLPGE